MLDNQPEAFHKKSFSELVEDLLTEAAQSDGGRIALTDAREGSVTRTLLEVFARELAVAYEQLDIVYQNAYLETAKGSSLDRVVDLLGIKRYQPGHLEGHVLFSRNLPAPEDIHIPTGTLIAGEGVLQCATVKDAVLPKGAREVQVAIKSLEPAEEGDGIPAGVLKTMPRPITGIEQVNNEIALVISQQGESDEALRTRARNAAQATQSGTVAAIELAAKSVGAERVKVLDFITDPSLVRGKLKVVIVDQAQTNISHQGNSSTIEDQLATSEEKAEKLLQRVHQAVEQVRPAGVSVECEVAKAIWVEIAAVLTLKETMDRHRREAIEHQLITQLNSYFKRLDTGDMVHKEKIRSILIGHDAVINCEAIQGEAQLIKAFEQESNTPAQLKNNTGLYMNFAGDLVIPADARAGIDQQRLPVRLVMQNPAPKVYVDLLVMLETENRIDSYTISSLKSTYSQFSNDYIQAKIIENNHSSPLALIHIVFLDWLEKSIKAINANDANSPPQIPCNNPLLTLRITHENTGEVIEIKDGERVLSLREQPIIRHVDINNPYKGVKEESDTLEGKA